MVLDPPAEGVLDGALGLRVRERAQLVWEGLEVAGEVVRHDVRPRGEELAELYVAWSELGKGCRDARLFGLVACPRPGKEPNRQSRGAREMKDKGNLLPGR